MTPLGTYHARTCADATSRNYDGQTFYDFTRLSSATGSPIAEIQFGDGQWKLCDPTRDLLPHFCLADVPSTTYRAISYGEPWNGWATPTVDRWTCQAILNDSGVAHRWDGSLVWLDEDASPTRPDVNGGYDLGHWGWMFLTALHWH